jgi:hypothetical protein
VNPEDLVIEQWRLRRAAAILRHRLWSRLPLWRKRRLLIGTRRSAS